MNKKYVIAALALAAIIICVAGYKSWRHHHKPSKNEQTGYNKPVEKYALRAFGRPITIKAAGEKFTKYTPEDHDQAYIAQYNDILKYMTSDAAREKSERDHAAFWAKPASQSQTTFIETKRAILETALGIPAPNDVSFDFKSCEAKKETGDYTVKFCNVPLGLGDLKFPAYVLEPKQPARGIVIGFHGYSSTPEKAAGLAAKKDYVNEFGVHFAKAGYVTLIPYVYSIGDLNANISAAGGLYTGYTAWGINLAKGRILLNAAKARKEWDKLPAAVYGISNGGIMAAIFGAVEPKIDIVISSGAMADLRDMLIKRYTRTDGNLPLRPDYAIFNRPILREFAYSDFARLIVPRPLIIELGSYDRRVVQNEEPDKEWQAIKETYMAAGRNHNLRLVWFQGYHEFVPELTIPQLDAFTANWGQ